MSCSIYMYKIQKCVSCIVYIHSLPLTELLIYQCVTILDLLLVNSQATDLASNSVWSQSTQCSLEGPPLNMVCPLKHYYMIYCTNGLTNWGWDKSRHFPDTIFRCIFLNENAWISIEFSMKFVPKGPVNNISALLLMMAWRQTGEKT